MQRQQPKKAPKMQSQRAAPRKQSKKKSNPSHRTDGIGMVPNRMLGLASSMGMTRAPMARSTRLNDVDMILNVTSVSAAAISCYTPRAITVRWLPSVAATVAGQVYGGSLAVYSPIPQANAPNSLMAVPGSVSGPVWENMAFKFDLSVLTQPRYFLNSTGDDGVPCNFYLVLPSTALGMIEISYDIDFYGPCIAPTDVPIYDIVPRTITTNGGLAGSQMTMSSYTGITAGTALNLVTAGSNTANPITLSTTSGGGGPTDFDWTVLNSPLHIVMNGTLNGFLAEVFGTPLYNQLAAQESQAVYGWLQGAINQLL